MNKWLSNNSATIRWWIALIVGCALVFALGRGTRFQQLGVGLLISAVTLLVSLTIVEVICQAAMRWLDGEEAAGKSSPKSRRDGR